MLPVNGMNNINNVKSRAIDCLLMKPTRRLTNIRLTICKKLQKGGVSPDTFFEKNKLVNWLKKIDSESNDNVSEEAKKLNKEK